MRRERPLKSVLAGRKMFNGGMMMPLDTPPAMQNTPSGILASSQPLIEAATQEAVAPMAMVNEPMSMAQGGSVQGFSNGGIQVTRLPSPEDFTMEAFDTSGIIDVNDIKIYSNLRAFGMNKEDAVGGVDRARTAMSKNPAMDINEAINFALKPVMASETLNANDTSGYSIAERDARMVINQRGAEDQVFIDQQKKILSDAQNQGPESYQKAVANLLQNPDYSQRFKSSVLGREPGSDISFVGKGTDTDTSTDQTSVDYYDVPTGTKSVVKGTTYTTDLSGLREYLSNSGTSAKEAPSSVLSKSIDSIIDSAIEKAEGRVFDKDKFKSEIESLLPAVEEDPQTEGLLLAMLGASIMAGESSSAWVNVGKGVEKSLPALIAFKNKQKESERDRQMAAAKMTIQESLSRDKETRTIVDSLQKQKTVAGIKEAERLLTPKDWWISKSITLPSSLLDGKKGDLDTFLPKGSTLSLSQVEYDKLSSLGVKALPFDRGSWKPSDILDMADTAKNAKHVKAMNAYGDRVSLKVFEQFKKAGALTVQYYTPSYGAMEAGARNQNMINANQLTGFMQEYRNVLQPAADLRSDVREILGGVLERPGSFTGFGKLLDETTDVIRGIVGKEDNLGIVKYLEGIGATQGLGAAEEARVKSLIVLAKIAPLLLDESGKTISDQDRRMIAQTLGLSTIPNDPNDPSKGFRVELNPGIFRNPQAIVLAINQTEQALNRRINAVNNEAKTYLYTFGVPSDHKEVLEFEKNQDKQLTTSGFKPKGLDFNFS